MFCVAINSSAACSHVWDKNGHCKNANCSAINRTLYATKYVEDTVTYNGSRSYQFKPVVSGVYTICTTGVKTKMSITNPVVVVTAQLILISEYTATKI